MSYARPSYMWAEEGGWCSAPRDNRRWLFGLSWPPSPELMAMSRAADEPKSFDEIDPRGRATKKRLKRTIKRSRSKRVKKSKSQDWAWFRVKREHNTHTFVLWGSFWSYRLDNQSQSRRGQFVENCCFDFGDGSDGRVSQSVGRSLWSLCNQSFSCRGHFWGWGGKAAHFVRFLSNRNKYGFYFRLSSANLSDTPRGLALTLEQQTKRAYDTQSAQ